MKIAIDLRPLQIGHQNRGIGIYLINIMKYFPDDRVEYVFLRYDESNPITDYSVGLNKKYSEIIYKRVKFEKSLSCALLFGLNILRPKYMALAKHHPDIFFQPDYLLGVPRSFRITKIIVFYDLIPFVYRSVYIPSWKKFWHYKNLRIRKRALMSLRAYYYEKKYKKGIKTLRKADKIISISKSTTEDLIDIAKINKKKISTVYLAPSFTENIHINSSSVVKSLVNKIDGKYLIYIGRTDHRRKVDELVYAFNLLNARGHDINLVLAGNEFVINSHELSASAKKSIKLSSYKDKIYMLGKISESDKAMLFRHAFAFVYPTLYEGFGLPIVESMVLSCPIITFENKATVETARDAAEYTESTDGLGIYKSVINLLENKNKRKILIEKGLKRSTNYSWDKTGHETMNLILGEDNGISTKKQFK
jgi:glycosyltransferase involved in cell wall biosynthesis